MVFPLDVLFSPLGMVRGPAAIGAAGENGNELREIGGTLYRHTWALFQQDVLHAPDARGPGPILSQGTRSHMLQLKILHASTKIEDQGAMMRGRYPCRGLEAAHFHVPPPPGKGWGGTGHTPFCEM